MTQYKYNTLQINAGRINDKHTGACATPIYQTSAFAFNNIEHARKLFSLEEEGNIYSRLNNPTVDVLEKRIAALEGGSAAVAVSSGMSAQILTITTLCNAGDNIISSLSLYGGTYNQFKVSLKKIGIDVKFSSCKEEEEVESLIDSHTKGIYVETIANSDFSIPDFGLLHKICSKYKIPLIVDNTLGCAGYLCSPAKHGANIIVHSATKAIGGHGNSIGGVIVDCGNFAWNSGKFPLFTQACESYHNISFWDTFKECTFAAKVRCEGLRDYGCCLSPFNAFLLLMGVETLSLRAQRISDNSLIIAQFLNKHPLVESVNYPGLTENINYFNAKKYLQNGFGGVFTIDLKANKQQTAEFVDSLKLFTLIANLGDNKSLIGHPASTTHGQLSVDELLKVGIKPSTLRLSIGIEDVEDLITDLSDSLAKIK